MLAVIKLHFLKTFHSSNVCFYGKRGKMSVLNPNACGIDVGSKFHYVATGQGNDEVKRFGVYTQDHKAMIAYLQEKSRAKKI